MQCAKGIDGWKVDTAQLAAVLRNIAPQVRLDDHR